MDAALILFCGGIIVGACAVGLVIGSVLMFGGRK